MRPVKLLQVAGGGRTDTHREVTMMAENRRHSTVFIVRTWTEAREAQVAELRGMVREVQSGETRYFRTWESLVAFVERHHTTQASRDSPNDESALGAA